MIIVRNLCFELFYFGMRLIYFKEINIERSLHRNDRMNTMFSSLHYSLICVAQQLIRTHYLLSQEASGKLNCVTTDLNHFKLRFLGIQASLVNL